MIHDSNPFQKDNLNKMTRREFIVKVSAFGISTAVIPSFLTGNLFASTGTDEALKNIAEKILWTGQASVKIPGLGANIYVDPFKIKAEDKADIVLITHSHDDHFSYYDLKRVCSDQTTIIVPKEVASKIKKIPQKETIIVAPGDTVGINDIKIDAVPMYNIKKTNYHPKSKNWVGYLIHGNGITVYHAGDTERIPEMKNIQCDIALLPLGQKYTMNSVEDAAESAKDVGAKLAIPIHYGLYEGTIKDAVKFKELLAGHMNVIILDKQK